MTTPMDEQPEAIADPYGNVETSQQEDDTPPPAETFVADQPPPPAVSKLDKTKEVHEKPGPLFHFQRLFRKFFGRYTTLKVTGVLLGLYIAVMSYAFVGTFGSFGGFVDPDRHYIIDANIPENNDRGVILTKGTERAIVAENVIQMICIGITRVSAFFMYPALIMVFITKFRATMEFISHTPISMFTNEDLHDLHVCCGWIILVDGVIHSIFHIIRWGNQGNLSLIFSHYSGRSGFVILICTLLICLPMIAFRKSMAYELRKALHYLFIVFATAMAFHSPVSTIPNGGFTAFVFPLLLVWYLIDYMYVVLFMTEKIETPVFHVLPTGVQLTMKVSERFQKTEMHGGYCYINFPWISKTEWHAYSLFENPSNPGERQIFIQTLGDWTEKVHAALQRNTARPVWVQGPFSSPYDSAVNYDDQILVAGGIGITPALSVMRAHKDTRRSNLIWAVRDPHMLEFFIKNGDFSDRGWNMIFYTGKETIIGLEGEVVAANGARVHVIRSRPNFAKIVPNLIYSIESGTAVPEAYVPDAKIEAVVRLKEKLRELDEDMDLSDADKVGILINSVQDYGFLFTELAEEYLGVEVGKNIGQGTTRNRRSGAMNANLLKSIRGTDDSHLQRHSLRLSTNSNGSASHHFSDIVHMRKSMAKQSHYTTLWSQMTTAATDYEEDPEYSFKPWEADPSVALDFVQGLDESVKRTWGMLYCGGKSPLADLAEESAKQFGIEIHKESFAW